MTTRSYDFDVEHPPLARIGFGLASWLRHDGAQPVGDRVTVGNELLLDNGAYIRNLALARSANLIWFVLTIAVVGIWSFRLVGGLAAIIAMALVSSLPPMLAHAGLATTDMAAAAAVTLALFCFWLWLKEPSWRHAIPLALAIGAGLVSKFSFPVFFAAGAVALLIRRFDVRARTRVVQLVAIVFIAATCAWASYKFSVGRIHDIRVRIYPAGSSDGTAARYAESPGYEWVRGDLIERYRRYGRFAEARGKRDIDFADWARAAGYPSPQAGRYGNTLAGAPSLPPPSFAERIEEPFRRLWQTIVMRVPLPAPSFFAGLEYVRWHATGPHPAFLLGRYNDRGWWYYFPVVFFFKTPLPFIAVAFAGVVMLAKRRDSIALAPLLMFVPSMLITLNIGVRHILPIYPLLCIVAGAYVAQALSLRAPAESRRHVVIVAILLAWFVAGTSLAHPDYLAWFNECAGRHPERIAVDSNLDWGQDLLRVRQAMKKRGIDHLPLAYFGSIDPHRLGIAADDLPGREPRHGWVAASEMRIAFGRDADPGDYAWLKRYAPVARIGRSIRLYRIP